MLQLCAAAGAQKSTASSGGLCPQADTVAAAWPSLPLHRFAALSLAVGAAVTLCRPRLAFLLSVTCVGLRPLGSVSLLLLQLLGTTSKANSSAWNEGPQ